MIEGRARFDGRTPAGEAAVVVLAREVGRLERHEDEAPRGEDPEALHQMRVATRRLRSAMRLFDPVLVLPRRARRKRLGEVADALGPVRDRDVWLGILEDREGPRLPPAEQRRLAPLLAGLRAERRAALDTLRRFLEGGRYRKTRRALAEYMEAPVLTTGAEAPLGAFLPGRLERLARAVFVHPGFRPGADGPALHDLRLAVKRARYATGFFADCYEETVAAWLRWLGALQDDLGAVTDCDVLLARLDVEGGGAGASPWLVAALEEQRGQALKRLGRAATAWADPAVQAGLLDSLACLHAEGANGALRPPADIGVRRGS